jgi:hypothetical protein
LRDKGVIEQMGRGVFRRTDLELVGDIDLLEVAHRVPKATICLTSALSRLDLIDDIPIEVDIALPRGQHRPVTTAPVAWHSFNPSTFDVGRTRFRLEDEVVIGMYGPERSIVDAMRLRHLEGQEMGIVALKRWLERPGSSPASLLAMARHFPRVQNKLREALEILL